MRRTLGVLTAALLGSMLLGAGPAAADVALSQVTLSTGTVVINGDAGCANRVKVTYKVYDPAPDPDYPVDITAEVVAPNGDASDFLLPAYASRSGDYTYYTDWVFLCGFEPPGRYEIRSEVSWWDRTLNVERVIERTTVFSVKRPTSVTYNAAPEPAKRGSYLTHSGQLKFDPFAPGAMYGAKNITLTIAFKRAGTTSYVNKATVLTGTGGYYSKKLQTWYDGTWRITYPGNTWRQPQVKYDYVDTY
jgi:hypothetical protein